MLLADLLNAFMLLTRLPVARFAPVAEPSRFGRCVWAFPIVGLTINAFGGAIYWLARDLGITPLAAAGWTLAAMVLATGALHEDGLADTADGLGGGTTRARKLEIMRDSRIGCYGALALLLSVIIRAATIAAPNDPHRVLGGLIVAGALGRGGILVVLAMLRPARDDGMGAAVGDVSRTGLGAGLGLAVAGSFVAGALLGAPVAIVLAAVILAGGVAFGMARFVQARIGGYTGDVLGAVEVVTECVVLTLTPGVAPT